MQGQNHSPLRVGVIIASAGRPALLKSAVEILDRQTVGPFVGLISVPDAQSLPKTPFGPLWHVVTGPIGSARQRNTALDYMNNVDIVFFFDDDSVVREDYMENALRFFEARPDVVGLTGRVLRDGVRTGAISEGEAARVLDESRSVRLTGGWRPSRELYGCNFAVRVDAAADLRFDDRLPLYSWLEDHDYARRLSKVGNLVQLHDAMIVHRAAASGGRRAHKRFGYSQVMNPIYLWRKGSFPLRIAARELLRPVLKNLATAWVGKQSTWRRDRLHGNMLAIMDVLRGRITPERIVTLLRNEG